MDRVPREVRSRIMRSIKKSNTKMERRFIEYLVGLGATGFECQAADLPGCPDLVFRASKIAVFLDSCFWHGCPLHCRVPKSNREYWINKINRNKERDITDTEKLVQLGWTVKRIWEHDLKNRETLRKIALELVAISGQ